MPPQDLEDTDERKTRMRPGRLMPVIEQRPGTTYEGKVVFADGSQISLQCYEDRVGECPGVLDNGYLCEGPCPDLEGT